MTDLSATSRCVKCGLCLPHCPTFAISGNEADSPRGRICLMHSLDQPDPVLSPGLFRHLDSCLQCRACEAMCPSQVPFAELMDAAQLRLEPLRKASPSRRLLKATGLRLLASPAWLKATAGLLRLWQTSGLQRLTELMPGLPEQVKRLNRLIPARQGRLNRNTTSMHAGTTSAVQLFRGCISRVFDRQTLEASRVLLEAQGFDVEIPSGQNCCGAAHQHNAAVDTARQLAAINIRAFAGTAPVICTASGCSAQLIEYGKQFDQQGAQAFASRVNDVLHFLLAQGPQSLSLKPLQQNIAVYVPCTHRNVLKQSQHLVDILGWIPGVKPLPVNPDGGCCGAAGAYLLSQPELSDQLREQVIDKILSMECTLLVTSNIGCSLQIQAGLRRRGVEIEVLHPVTLLARQLSD